MRDTFLPYNVPYIGEDEITAVVDVLRSGWLTTGQRTLQFEAMICEITGAKHAVAVNSCTSGLHVALVALDIGPGDEVILPDMTFCSTANVVIHTGATPVFVDVLRDTYHIDPAAVRRAITARTRAIMPVHFAGQACDMDAIQEIAQEHSLAVIEDAAHAIGASYKGRPIGGIGDVTVFSFYSTKNVTTGEGGVVTTNDSELASRVRRLALHGISRDAWKRYSAEGSWYYEVLDPGFKYNLTDLAAAIGISQLKRMHWFSERRSELAQRMTQGLGRVPGVLTPRFVAAGSHVWHLYVVEVDAQVAGIGRDALIERLRARNIGTSVHFIPLHLHPAYRPYVVKPEAFPASQSAFGRILSLPLYPKMSEQDVDDVVTAISDIVAEASS